MTSYFIYVPRSSANNFQLGRAKATWGTKKDAALKELRDGDEVVFVHDITAPEPPPKGFPRVPLAQFRGTAKVLLRARVVGDPYEGTQPLWPDDIYPHRFRFEELRHESDAAINESTLTDPERNAVRL